MIKIKPTLTVVIPSYNKEHYIDRCIKSILAEKKFIDEIILVDNYSTDDTFKYAQKYEPEIKCFQNERNLGMSGNWNKCIDLCHTDWLMIFHADDELLPGSMSKYLDFIEKFPSINLIHAGSYTVINGDQSSKILYKRDDKEFWQAGEDAMSCSHSACSAVLVKKNAYNQLGYFIDSSLSSDVEMWSRIASKFDIGLMNLPTVIYHINPTSTGYDSLVNRSIKEIRADWDLLERKIADNYSTKDAKDLFTAKMYRNAPGSYWAVVKANLKAGHYLKVIQTVFLIIFVYRGFFPLVKLSLNAFKKIILKKYIYTISI